MVRNQGRVTRFVVMAVLQAARARALGLSKESAFSWGLNRAIFYAAAKRGFQRSAPKTGEPTPTRMERASRETFRLGDEEAIRSPNAGEVAFTIGDKTQTVQEFERSVSTRFGTNENFGAAWDEALRIIGEFDRATLESQRRFYDEVYRPRRDELSDGWTLKYSPAPRAKK
ncbi:MAG: hypothetical protein L3J97_01520 [Thermoplasmata archaeon]|nr:hypothetical protein [Thermoplasmata archaeon]